MSSWPLWLKLFHLFAAFWVTAGVFGSTVVRAQLRKAATLPEKTLAARLLWRLHAVYTLPGLVLAGLVGFYLVTARGYRFAEVWVAGSSLLWLMMLLWTLFALTPALRRLHGTARAASASEEAVPAFELAAGNRLWGILSDVNALTILILVYLMVLKP